MIVYRRDESALVTRVAGEDGASFALGTAEAFQSDFTAVSRAKREILSYQPL